MRTASIVLVLVLVPSAAWAASEDPCARAEYALPKLHSSSMPLVRDGWLAFDLGYEGGSLTDVRLRDGSGREIAASAVFGGGTRRSFEIFEPAQAPEAGIHELVFMHHPECFEPREVTMQMHVVSQLAEPIAVPPVITEVDAELWGGDLLELVITVEDPPESAPPAWLRIEADFVEHDLLFAPQEYPLAELDRYFDDGREVTEVCARATYYDLAGNPSPTTELCTTDIEPRENEQGVSCRAGGRTSPSWALGLLLGLALHRRRRKR